MLGNSREGLLKTLWPVGSKRTAPREVWAPSPGGFVDAPTLLLLGAAGGALRCLVDIYARFEDWQADRRVYRRLPPDTESQSPRFGKYFDPVADPVAGVLHTLMGAGGAWAMGAGGQITGTYAAVVIGMSAPTILTQLCRIPSLNEALTGPAPAHGSLLEAHPLEAPVAPPFAAPSPTQSAAAFRQESSPGRITGEGILTPAPRLHADEVQTTADDVRRHAATSQGSLPTREGEETA